MKNQPNYYNTINHYCRNKYNDAVKYFCVGVFFSFYTYSKNIMVILTMGNFILKEVNRVKNIQWLFLIYAVLAVVSMIGIGFSIAFQSIPFIFLFTLLVILIMVIGFQTKKKMREAGKL